MTRRRPGSRQNPSRPSRKSTSSCTSCSTRPPSWRAPRAPRAAWTWPRPRNCWPRSRRSTRSSGRPSRPKRYRGPACAPRSSAERRGAPRFSPWPAGGRLLAVGGDRKPARRRDVTEDTAATTAVPGQRDPAAAQADRDTTQDHVTVCMPAEGAYLSVLRTATAGLAARLDFTLDEIEDLRIAVDEACAMLLAQAIPGTNLECAFDLGAEEMTITVSVIAAEPRIPARDTFAWTVLSALAGTVDSRLGADDQVSIVLRERGVEFSTYATPTIVGEIKRHFRDKGWAVRVPRRLQELKLSLTKAIGDLAQREGRAPTVSELAAHLQMSEEEVLEGLESANAYSTVSLDAPDSGDEDAPAVADSLGMVDEALEGVEYRESLKPLLEQLPPREKKILLLRFFGNMTQSQIAAELGISQMHVSRLLARTLAQLRDGLTTDD